MSFLAPLAVAVPLLVAAALIAVNRKIPRIVADGVAIVTGAIETLLCAGLLVSSIGGTVVYWFGGWNPGPAPPVAISFAVDPIGGGFATLIALLTTAALIHSWRFHETVGTLLHVLLLVFMAAMVGFALTGDLFNLFVFFELMSVAAYSLTGYEIELEGPLLGAMNLGVTNALAGSFVLVGVGLVYARTGTLNMAAAGRAIAGHPVDALVVVAFVMILTGLITKGSIVPFHFWLADAHAVAPAPVCALFSGVMVELGLYGVARIYWTVFSGALGPGGAILRAALLAAGVVTAVVGAVMCLAQRHLKRLIAFSTVAHDGVFLIGISLLSVGGIAGVAIAVTVHALAKASLFLGTGAVLHRKGTVDEHELHGAGRHLYWTAAVFLLSAMVLAGVPPFGMPLGEGGISAAAADAGLAWVGAVVIVTAILTAGAILRATAGVFGGWGVRRELSEAASPTIVRETEGPLRRTPPTMLAPAFAMLFLALLIGLVPAVSHGIDRAAEAFLGRTTYAKAVLLGAEARPPSVAPSPWWDAAMLREAAITTVGAAIVMVLGVFGRALVNGTTERILRPARAVIGVVRSAHDGHVGNYVAWMSVGAAILGGVLLLGYR